MNCVDISVSIISTNERHRLERLLPSLVASARLASTEILLVDNYSQDGTGEYVREHFPSMQVLRNDVRAGYGENHNRNLARARGRYFLIMNTDLLLGADVFVRL